MKKKVLFVINSLGCGGAEKSLVSLLSAFDYEKYEVYLQMLSLGGMFAELLPREVHILSKLDYIEFCEETVIKQLRHPIKLGIKIQTSLALKCNSRKKVLHDAQCYWKYARNAFSELPEKYDVAIAWGQGNPTHFVCDKVNSGKKIAFVNADYEKVGHNKDFDYLMYKKYDYIVAVSDLLKTKLYDVFPDMKDKILAIYDINHAGLIQKMASLENPFVNAIHDIKIVTVGRLVAEKGYDLLVEACRILRDRKLNFEWHIIGEGPERKKIEQYIETYQLKNNLILHGAKANPYVYMGNADIYVQTSKAEGYCLTLGEARILNKPVVSTNFDVVYNQIENEVNGLIVEMTGEAIAEGIVRILQDDELRRKIVCNVKKEKKGNIEEVLKLYMLLGE